MKGLLLKDFYMARKYCRAYLLIVLVFALASPFTGGNNLFMLFYPCILASMVPVNLLAYEAQCKWEPFAGTLPYSRCQLVSAKYLTGLISAGLVLVLSGIAQIIGMLSDGGFRAEEFLSLMAALALTGCVVPAITLPLIFRFGVEKGRIVYLVMVGLFCGISAVASIVLPDNIFAQAASFTPALPLAFLAAVGLYALSWFLSTRFYGKREL